jgi:monoamine oxidase
MATSALARTTGMPVDEASARLREGGRSRLDRRMFLKAAASVVGAAGVAAAVPPVPPLRPIGGSRPRVVIVGAGLAGLRCAHRLWTERGLSSTVYEWDDHPGGRVVTYRDVFAGGQVIEEHGEFVSSEHHSMLRLARRFDLALDDTSVYPRGAQDTFWMGGRRYTQADLDADWHAFGWKLFHRVGIDAGLPATYRHHTPDAYALDHQSVAEWIDAEIPGGLASPFGSLCSLDTMSEFGGRPEEQSAINLVSMLTYDTSTPSGLQSHGSPLLAGTDERWHVHGGNDQIVSGMVAELPEGTVRTGQRLVALREHGNGTLTCTFDSHGVAVDVVADHVVLTLPFTKLREVDLTRVTLSALKRVAIGNLQLGSNAKVALQVAGTPWGADGYTGNTFADNGAVGGWTISNYQPGPDAIFLDFPGGAPGSALASRYGLVSDHGPAPDALVRDQLAVLEPIFPGTTAAWEAGPRIAWYADGNIDEHIGGAYSYYQVGQTTRFSGIEGVREGNVHFAGEHTSPDFQGFMEGAVTSGERVAAEL